MVNKNRYKESVGVPPPLDESWWEAVLTEDEAAGPSTSVKRLSPGGTVRKAALQSQAAEPPALQWEKAFDLYELDESVNLLVSGFNRGGLLVHGEGLHGFVPISHLVDMPDSRDEADQEQWLSSYVGQSLYLKVIECDQERGRVVFSERAALAEPGSRNLLLHRLRTNDCIQGSVTNITDFGIFVDLGGVEGLIHVSEISWGRVRHPSDVVRLGQRVDVYVINVDQDRARVALSLKRLYPNPWETAEARYYPGMVTEAVVTSIVPYGAFARLEEGLDGLIHISELCDGDTVNTPTQIVYEGQRVNVRVLHVDGSKQRLGLSLRLEAAS